MLHGACQSDIIDRCAQPHFKRTLRSRARRLRDELDRLVQVGRLDDREPGKRAPESAKALLVMVGVPFHARTVVTSRRHRLDTGISSFSPAWRPL